MASASDAQKEAFTTDRGGSRVPSASALPPRILVLSPHAPESGVRVRDILLAAGGYSVSVQAAVDGSADLIIPILTPGLSPLAVLTELHASVPEAKLLPVFDESHLPGALDRLPPGVTDFLAGAIRGPELLARVRRLCPLDVREEIERVRDHLHESMGLERLRGVDPAFVRVKQQILRVAKADVTVLLTGETGTGKELTAQAIHYLSPRATKPFVPVDCGAIPASLFENELFGHRRGAFTDARFHQHGLVAEADGGTLFLDEIDALPLTAQVKLLRFLEDRKYRPLGSPRSVTGNVRLVAATNTDLKQKVREGRFREDLFYRLHVVTLRLPPLRERLYDITLLVECFLERYATTRSRCRFTPQALQALRAYDWPGNVRELENMVRQLVIMNPSNLIQPKDIPFPARSAEVHPVDSFRTAKAQAVVQFERTYLARLLQTHRGNITRAAQAARQDRRTFRRLIQKHHLNPSM